MKFLAALYIMCLVFGGAFMHYTTSEDMEPKDAAKMAAVSIGFVLVVILLFVGLIWSINTLIT